MNGLGYPGAGIVVAAPEEDEADADADADELSGNDDAGTELAATLITGSGSPFGIFQ